MREGHNFFVKNLVVSKKYLTFTLFYWRFVSVWRIFQ